MEIIVGKTAGFCYGVKRAVEGAKSEIKKNKRIGVMAGASTPQESILEIVNAIKM